MTTQRHRRQGYTLTELLIVIAIIAMLTGVAIPAFIKLSGFLAEKSDGAARDLYGVLRAARISAISYRNDIAVVYLLHNHPDNYFGGQSLVIDGYGTARRASKEQIAAITTSGSPSYQADFEAALNSSASGVQSDDIFVLASEPQSRFRAMPKETAVIGHLTAQEEQMLSGFGYLDQPPQTVEAFFDGVDDVSDPNHLYEGMESRGMRLIYLFDEDDYGRLVPVTADVALNSNVVAIPNAIRPYAFPAHVFLPTGELGVPGSSLEPWKERISVAVGPAPDAPKDERFAVAPEVGTAQFASPHRIELYRSTGRVQIAS